MVEEASLIAAWTASTKWPWYAKWLMHNKVSFRDNNELRLGLSIWRQVKRHRVVDGTFEIMSQHSLVDSSKRSESKMASALKESMASFAARVHSARAASVRSFAN